jgi:hypothetical protein
MTGSIPTTLGLIDELGKNINIISRESVTIRSFSTISQQSPISSAGLSVFDNFLSGTIPTELSGLANLQLIYLDDNDLIGSVPDGICQLDLEEFWSDCEETQCLCCTTCCSDGFGCV